jgi:sporulation protein YlmC with PRC-barrel domain
MPRASFYEGLTIVGPKGKPIGEVKYVLYHPTEPRAIGFEVDRKPVLGVVGLRTRFLPFAALDVPKGATHATYDAKRFPSPAKAASEADADWDAAVVWTHMPVRTESGQDVGRVREVIVGRRSGRVREITLSEGATADMAVGRATIPVDEVLGFDGEAVVVTDVIEETVPTGGVAHAAGAGTAVAKHVAGETTQNAARAAGRAAARMRKRMRGVAQEWKDLLDTEE